MVLSRLREQTRPHHDRVERDLNLAERLSSVSRYRELLARFLGFYDPVERRIAELPVRELLSLDFARRRKVVLLRRDLGALGMSDGDIERLPVCEELPALDDVPRSLGCMYVLEGATLGGQIISRQLKDRLGLDERSGGAFFRSYGAETGRMWKEFGAVLDAYAASDEIEQTIVAAACDTFIRFDGWLAAETSR